MRRRSGFILSGPPGTGKTLLARVLAADWTAERERSFLWVTPGDLQSVTDVEETFELARLLAPAPNKAGGTALSSSKTSTPSAKRGAARVRTAGCCSAS